jgi:hypothetical protein
MPVSIEQRIEDLLGHADVWDETKEGLRDMLADQKAGRLDPDDERYIQRLHEKVFGGRAGQAAPAASGKLKNRGLDMTAVKPANDDTAAPSMKRGLDAPALIAALREDIANLVVPGDMNDRPADEQELRGEIVSTLQATLDELAAKKEN